VEAKLQTSSQGADNARGIKKGKSCEKKEKKRRSLSKPEEGRRSPAPQASVDNKQMAAAPCNQKNKINQESIVTYESVEANSSCQSRG
jgi:hypothetical protein